MTKECRSANDEWVTRWFGRFCEDEMEFFGFLPDGFGRVAQFKDSADEHPSEKLGFPRFLFAGADLVAELFFGNRVISLAVIRTDAGARTHELRNEPCRD